MYSLVPQIIQKSQKFKNIWHLPTDRPRCRVACTRLKTDKQSTRQHEMHTQKNMHWKKKIPMYDFFPVGDSRLYWYFFQPCVLIFIFIIMPFILSISSPNSLDFFLFFISFIFFKKLSWRVSCHVQVGRGSEKRLLIHLGWSSNANTAYKCLNSE